MKVRQRDFTSDLSEKIYGAERALNDCLETLLKEYRPIFKRKNLGLEAEFEQEEEDPFTPGYRSTVSIGVTDKAGELLDLHIVTIWECGRYFLGIPVSRNLPGSKIIGEFLEESLEEVKLELKEYLEGQLEWDEK